MRCSCLCQTSGRLACTAESMAAGTESELSKTIEPSDPQWPSSPPVPSSISQGIYPFGRRGGFFVVENEKINKTKRKTRNPRIDQHNAIRHFHNEAFLRFGYVSWFLGQIGSIRFHITIRIYSDNSTVAIGLNRISRRNFLRAELCFRKGGNATRLIVEIQTKQKRGYVQSWMEIERKNRDSGRKLAILLFG